MFVLIVWVKDGEIKNTEGMRLRMKCEICEDKVYYYNVVNGDWTLCPKCDLIRIAKAITKVSYPR